MQGRVIFLLEEPSMRVLLDDWLPRLFPGWVDGRHFQCVPHEGKNDLDRSIPRKLAAWRIPGDRFVIVRDNDNANCVDLKTRLEALCWQGGRPETLIRLVCQELESWYLGDLAALATAFDEPTADTAAHRKRYAHPDDWQRPSVEVKRLVPVFQKHSGARVMAQHLDPQNNRSKSLQAFVTGLRYVLHALPTIQRSPTRMHATFQAWTKCMAERSRGEPNVGYPSRALGHTGFLLWRDEPDDATGLWFAPRA